MIRRVLALALVLLPALASAQTVPGSPFGGSSSGSGVTWPVSDAVFSLSDDASPTKLMTFQLSSITAGQTSVLTVPDADFTLAGSNIVNTWGATQTVTNLVAWDFGSPTMFTLYPSSQQTPDAGVLALGTINRHFLVIEAGDAGTDFAHPQQTNPTMFFQNAAASTTQHNGVAFYGNQGRAIKALTESAATSVVQIPVAALTGVGGTITFTVVAADATDIQTLTGVLQYAAVAKLTVETCATPTLTGTALNSVSAGTLTCTYACDTSPANAVNIQFNCVSSLTQTTLDAYWRLNALGASEPLPQ